MKGIKTGGRAAGTPNKRNRAHREGLAAAKEKIEKALGKDAFQGDAHAFLIATYKDVKQPVSVRIDAAKAAIAYERPRLSALHHSLGEDVGAEARKLGMGVLQEVRDILADETTRIEGGKWWRTVC